MPILRMVQEFSGQAPSRLDKEIQMILRLLRPRDHYEWMTLQEGPEADGRYPKVDGLSGFDVKWFLQLYADPDRAIFVSNTGSCTTVTEDTVFADDHIRLGNAHKQKQPCRDV
jgi:hypothetical protein